MSPEAARPPRLSSRAKSSTSSRRPGEAAALKAEQVTMAPAPGQGDADDDRGSVSCPRSPRLERTTRTDLRALADAGRVTVDGTGLAMTTDSVVVSRCASPWVDRRSRGQRDRQRPRDGRRQGGGDHPRDDPRGGPARRGPARRGRSDRRRGGDAGVSIVAGTRRSSNAVIATACTYDTGVVRIDPRASLSAARPACRATWSSSRSIGEHGTAIMLSRDEFALDARSSRTPSRCGRAADALARRCGRACAACATRPAAASRPC